MLKFTQDANMEQLTITLTLGGNILELVLTNRPILVKKTSYAGVSDHDTLIVVDTCQLFPTRKHHRRFGSTRRLTGTKCTT